MCHLQKRRERKLGKRRVRTPPMKYAPCDIRTVGRRPRLIKRKIVSATDVIDVHARPWSTY